MKEMNVPTERLELVAVDTPAYRAFLDACDPIDVAASGLGAGGFGGRRVVLRDATGRIVAAASALVVNDDLVMLGVLVRPDVRDSDVGDTVAADVARRAVTCGFAVADVDIDAAPAPRALLADPVHA